MGQYNQVILNLNSSEYGEIKFENHIIIEEQGGYYYQSDYAGNQAMCSSILFFRETVVDNILS